jgi:hypothetical protein
MNETLQGARQRMLLQGRLAGQRLPVANRSDPNASP